MVVGAGLTRVAQSPVSMTITKYAFIKSFLPVPLQICTSFMTKKSITKSTKT